MSAETQWNKKIDFSPKKDNIAKEPIIQEGFEEIDEMVHKLKAMRNKKKGFTKLPFLESIYESMSKSEPTEPLTDDEPIEPISNEEPLVEGMTTNSEKYKYITQYMSNLPYNISFDVFAYSVYQISTGKQPKFPGKEPKKPPDNATQEVRDKYNKAKAKYDKLKPEYNEKKRVADMFNRVLTCLIGIFIAYNLYFSYAMTPPPAPGAVSTFEMISTFIENLPPVLFPLKCAATPVVYFIKLMSLSGAVISTIPYQPLLFGVCLILSYFFTTYVMGYLTSEKKETENIIFILIVLLSVIATALKICMDFKNPMPITQIPALLMWLVVFGLSLSFLPIGKIIIGMILLYVGMFSMTKSEKNGFNVLQTMEDIDEKLTGSKVIYDCSDDGPFQQFLKMIDKLISTIIVENLYLITLIPISVYNIYSSKAISNLYVGGFSNLLFSSLIIALLTNNENIASMFSWLMKGAFQMPISSQTASTSAAGTIKGIGQLASLISRA
jgi:hypothetical protein